MKALPIVFLLTFSTAAAQIVGEYPLRRVPFTRVKVTDRFWGPRLDSISSAAVHHALEQCELTGRIDNFRIAAGLMQGHYKGWWFNDSDVYKVIEAAAYSLAKRPDPVLETRIDSIISLIAGAQEPDGYLYAPRKTAAPDYGFREHLGPERWTNLASSHELYDLGHLYEAAAAYEAATGKRTLLDVAQRSADLLLRVFGPGKNRSVPGHQEIELALVKLWRTTGNERYAELAKFFLDERGRSDGHTLYGEYSQDHMPVSEQKVAVGHAVRALYMYAGMTDLGVMFADSSFGRALNWLWEDVVGTKTYLTGGIGAAGGHEGFSYAYELPNRSAYCETCAAIASVLWNERMFLASGDSKYVDVLERTLYNGVISGVALDGRRFFYTNPLESDGSHERSPWFAVACCPPNVARILPQVPGMAYAFDDKRIFANLFIAGTADIPFGKNRVTITQETNYPWDGTVTMTVDPGPAELACTIAVRVPGWARGEAIPLELYRFYGAAAESPSLTVNGTPQAIELRKGYVEIRRTWHKGDRIQLVLPMSVRRVESRKEVLENRSKVALQRGPLVYCVEGADMLEGHVVSVVLPDDAEFTTEHRNDLLGGVTVLRSSGQDLHWVDRERIRREPVDLVAIPYYAWAHRTRGEMAVWLAKTDSAARPVPLPTIASAAKPSSSGGDAGALNDQREPISSADRTHRYLHWWPRKGTTEWVQYDFPKDTTVSAVEVYWYDDTGIGECAVPSAWQILYRDGETWEPVKKPTSYGLAKDRYNRTSFVPVVTTGLRIVLTLPDTLSAGIHEWRVE